MWPLSEAQRWSPSPRMRILTASYRCRRNWTVLRLFPQWQGRRARFKKVECNFLSAPIITVSKAGPIKTRTNWRGRARFRVEGGRELVVAGDWFVMPDRDCRHADIKREIRLATLGLRVPNAGTLVDSPRLAAPLRWALRRWCRLLLWRGICTRPGAARPVSINGEPMTVRAPGCGECVVCLAEHLTNRWIGAWRREDRDRIRMIARIDVAFLYAEGKLNLVRTAEAYQPSSSAFCARPLAVHCAESRAQESVG